MMSGRRRRPLIWGPILTPLITDTFEASDALKAFEHANDRSNAMKVQLEFS